uniref:Gypsy-type retrotransposon protein n=1 Tax=Oryza sativa subsp. japonica TaxID=39947 RepID=Q6F2H7_ORYSJ|nr:putative gypsy-type retrotransposon protein [Oryza sativa Japonica Group]
MDLGKSASTSATLKKLQEDGALPGRENAEREAGGTNPQPILGRMVVIEDYVVCGFLSSPSEFLLLVLNFYGLSLLHLNPNSIAFLSVFVHLCEAYIGVEPFLDLFRFYYELRWMEPNRVSGCVGFRLRDGMKSRYVPFQCPSSRSKWRNRWFYLEIKDSNPILVVPEEQQDSGLSSEAVERRVGQVMISGPTTASDIPAPFCERGVTEHDEAINALPLTDVVGPLADHQVAASLKEKVVKVASDAATTSGGKAPTKARKFSSVLGHRRKAATPSASDVSPPPARRKRIVTIGEKEARANVARAKSGGTSSASPVTASTDVVPVVGSREATPSGPVSDPAGGRGLPEAVLTWEELQVEMGRLLEAGARGIGREISEARAETAAANARAERLVRELAEAREDLTKMRELVAGNERQRKGLEDRMSELGDNLSEIRGSLRVTYTGLHQLAEECGIKSTIPANPDEFSLTSSLAELATAMGKSPPSIRPGSRRRRPTASIPGRVMSSRVDADDEDVQQRGQPESLAIIPVFEFEPHVPHDVEDQTLDAEVEVTTTASNLKDALATQDRRIQYWKTKFEVVELERIMLSVKKEQAVETLRGREVWFGSYLKNCCTSMARVCRELRVVRGDPEESAAGYISWLNGACAQLDGIGKRIDEALKQECHLASRYFGGHVLACLRDHRPRLDLEFLREGFSCSRRNPAEIDHLARSMSPLAEKIFQSMDWHWLSW